MVKNMNPFDWVTFAVPTMLSIAALIIALKAAHYSREQARSAAEALNMQKEEARRKWISWELVEVSDGEYLLRNTGTRTAKFIEVDWGDLLSSGPGHINELQPGHDERYKFEAHINSTTDRLSLSWLTPGIHGRQTRQLLL